MSGSFLPQFRRQLFDWLQHRVAGGRLPFRRVEETPTVMTGRGLSAPDLVLWINRDSFLAGAMILVPSKTDDTLLQTGAEQAACLGLRQFVTWESRKVSLWEVTESSPKPLQHWPIPSARAITADDFAITFEQMLQAVKNLAVSAVMPASQLPPAYFANLCLQTLRDIEPALQESARMAAGQGLSDSSISHNARDKGWLTLWRLLALLRYDRMPPGIRPERLDRALGYPLAELDRQRFWPLIPSAGEAPLPESAAIRLHHLAGRLSQLGWHQRPDRMTASLGLLFAEAARNYHLDTLELQGNFSAGTLLINHLPPHPPAECILIAPQPCLAGWMLLAPTGTTPRALTEVDSLSADIRPEQIFATLLDSRPLPASRRRPMLTALRHPWPYRRFRLAGETPAWLWDALYLGGVADPDGGLHLTLPPAWTNASGAGPFWAVLTERLALVALKIHVDGRQTLTLTGHTRAPDTLTVCHPDGTRQHLPLLTEDAELSAVAALASTTGNTKVPAARGRKPSPPRAEQIAARVFCDGLPRFPEQYLRRIDLPEKRTYELPGPLQIDSRFFDRTRLIGPDGTFVDTDNPADAEALLLASRDGRRSVDLPSDPALTLKLSAAYKEDLRRLWQALHEECRRHCPAQRRALAMARRLWREHGLPSLEAL